jgi:hypothetical protein
MIGLASTLAPYALRAAPWIVAAGIGSAGWMAHNHAQQALGARDVLLKQDRMTIAALEDNAKHQAVQYTTDTVTLHEVTTQWRTKTEHFRDTSVIAVHDTVAVSIETVREVVKIGDSTIHACALVVSDCNQRLTTATAIGENYRNQLQLTKTAVPSALRTWTERGLAAGIGLGAGWLAWHRRP